MKRYLTISLKGKNEMSQFWTKVLNIICKPVLQWKGNDIFGTSFLRYVAAAKGIRMGRGREVFMGALVSKEHMEKVRKYINYAIEDNGKILCGETVNIPLLEDEEGPDKEGNMSGGNLHWNDVSTNNIELIITIFLLQNARVLFTSMRN